MPKTKLTSEQRFWNYIDKQKNCWIWTGSLDGKGYGRISVNNKIISAHRYSYTLHKGEIPKGTGYHGTCVCHSCDITSCVNPDHLFLGSQTENMYDRYNKNIPKEITNERNKQIIKLHSQGFNYSQIGFIFNLAHTTIMRIIKRNK